MTYKVIVGQYGATDPAVAYRMAEDEAQNVGGSVRPINTVACRYIQTQKGLRSVISEETDARTMATEYQYAVVADVELSGLQCVSGTGYAHES